MKKLSFILALVLILSTFTFPTFAAVADTDEAKIGDVGYETLAKAIAAATEGDEIVLLKDVTYNSSYTFQTASVTINGNGKTLTTSVSSGLGPFYVKGGKTLTFKNLTVNATLSSTSIWGIAFVNGGHVVLENCKVNAEGPAALGVYGLNGSGTVTLKNTVTTSNFGIHYHNNVADSGTVIVADGEGTKSSLTAPTLSDVAGMTEIAGLTFTQNSDPFNEAVATIGDNKYPSLETAIAYAAANGGTIELLKDVTIASPEGINITPSQNFTVNGNGNTVTSLIQTTNARATFYIQAKTVTFNNVVFESSLNGTGCWGVIISKNAGTNVILNECTVNARGTASLGTYSFIGGGSLQLNNTTTKSIFKGFYFFAANAGTITATGSTLVAPSIGDTTVASGLTFTENTDPFDEAVASIGSKNYGNFSSALEALQDGDTLKLKKDIEEDVAIDFNKSDISWIFDGNGKELSTTAASVFVEIRGNNHSVVIKNLTITSNATSGYGVALRIGQGQTTTTVTLDNCTVSTKGSANTFGPIIIQDNGTLNVTNGTTLDGSAKPAVRVNTATSICNVYDGTLKTTGTLAVENAGTFKMYGGKTVVGSTTTSYNPVMLDGASIRTNDQSNGIRFTTPISAELLAHIKSLGATSVSYGTVIFKAESYKALGNAAPAAAGWAAGTYVDIPATNGFVGDQENGPFVFNAALTNIQDKNLDANFGAISYVEYTVGSETFRIYSEYNEENNSRKIKDVALAALKDIANASTNGEYTEGGWEYKYEIAFYYDENGQRVEGKAYSCYTAEQYAVVEKIYNRQPVAN